MTSSTRLAPILLFLWGAAAIAAVASGLLTSLPFPPPLLVPITVVLAILAILMVPGVAAWIGGLDIRALVALHLVRFIGGYFLWLCTQGRLVESFALPAGIGDLIVAVGALGLLLTGYARPGRPLLWWNILGTLDILMVVANALRAFFTAPEGITEFFHLPLGLLPTYIVPLIILSHLAIFVRLLRPLPPTPSP